MADRDRLAIFALAIELGKLPEEIRSMSIDDFEYLLATKTIIRREERKQASRQ